MRRLVCFLLPSWICLLAAQARADDTVVPAGMALALDADLVLSGGDSLVAGDDSGARCAIHGNGKTIRAADDWVGAVTILNCDIDGLGASNADAANLRLAGTQAVTIRGTTFSTSGQLIFATGGQSSLIFQHNTIAEDSVVSAVTALDDSAPAILITGTSGGDKLFQGNLIRHSRVQFQATGGWLIGGEQPGDGNVLIGTRAGLDLNNVTDMVVEGNYSHTTIPMTGWNQVKNFSVGGSGLVVRHNVFWGMNWLIELNAQSDFSYNLLIDNVERGWVLVWDKAGAAVHHNVIIATRDNKNFNPEGAFVLEDNADSSTAPNTQIYNNTFEGGGVCVPAIKGLLVFHGSYLASLRSNAFVDARVAEGVAGLVRAGPLTDGGLPPPMLDYSDYNLFHAPASPVTRHYGVSVTGKAEGDPGFAAHDLSATGAVGPLFVGQVPRAFPFLEAEVMTRDTTVCQILAYYRQTYAPATTSPLLNAGDPADGDGNNIGAIGNGEASDLFGRAPFCDPADIGHPMLNAALYTCPTVPAGGSDDVATGPHGFMCVCELTTRPPHPALPMLTLAIGAAALVGRRRRGG